MTTGVEHLDDRPQLVNGKTVRLNCGCQLMRAPTRPGQRWWCHGAWQTVRKT